MYLLFSSSALVLGSSVLDNYVVDCSQRMMRQWQ